MQGGDRVPRRGGKSSSVNSDGMSFYWNVLTDRIAAAFFQVFFFLTFCLYLKQKTVEDKCLT